MIASRASAQCAHRPLHRSSETLYRRPSGTQPRPGITSTSSTRSLATNAPGYLYCHTVGGVCAQVHASDPAIRKEATPPYETHVGGTQHMCLSAGPAQTSWGNEAPVPFCCRSAASASTLEAGSWSKWIGQSGARRRWPARSGESIHVTARLWGGMPPPLALIWQCSTQHEHLRAGCQIQLLWLGGRRTLSPTHQNRSRLSWHESRNACEGMRRRGEHSAHTLHRTRARRPPEANFRARRWLWTAPHDDAPSE